MKGNELYKVIQGVLVLLTLTSTDVFAALEDEHREFSFARTFGPTFVAHIVPEHDVPVTKTTTKHLGGERFVHGRVTSIRSEQIIVDIGNPEPLYLPLKPAIEKGMNFHMGDAIVVTMNDHNAIVDYHLAGAENHHRVIQGQLIEPLPVGQEKAIIRTTDGEKSYPIASRARGKLGAMPVKADLVFLLDESGQLIDAQLDSKNAVHQSGMNNKAARLTGVNQRIQAIYKNSTPERRSIIVVVLPEEKELVFSFWPPLPILKELHENQPVTLLVDKQHIVVDIATSDPPPREFQPTQ